MFNQLLIIAASLMVPWVGYSYNPLTVELEKSVEEFPFPTYLQDIVVMPSAKDANVEFELSLTPLYHDYERAVSCRWDDNQFAGLELKPYLDERGVKATWYLNSNEIFYLTDLDQDFRQAALTLLENGHSIGGHTKTHPYLTYCHRNGMFDEVISARIEWEAFSDTPVLSHAFSFVDYRNAVEGDLVQHDIIRSLMRAGLYHAPVFANLESELKSDLILSIIMPPENQTFEEFVQAVDWATENDYLKDNHPLISHSMHAWYGTPAVQYGFEELALRLDYLNSFDNFWQTNQNNYAAYRYQYTRSRLVKKSNVDYLIERPHPVWLNNETPLSVAITGSFTEPPVLVLDGQRMSFLSERSSDSKFLFELPHTARLSVPDKIEAFSFVGDDKLFGSKEFPGIEVKFAYENGLLTTTLENNTGKSIEHLNLTWRLPVAFSEGVEIRRVANLPNGESTTFRFVPSLSTNDPKVLYGDALLVAQLDFLSGEDQGRVYLKTRHSFSDTDEGLPSNGVEVYGHVHKNLFSVDAFSQAIQAVGGMPADFRLTDGTLMQRRDDIARSVFRPDELDPEIVATSCHWYETVPRMYVLHSILSSELDADVQLWALNDDVHGIWLNGEKVEGFDLSLQEGENEFILVYGHESPGGSPRYSGAWMRLVDPKTGLRTTNVRWVRPIINPRESE